MHFQSIGNWHMEDKLNDIKLYKALSTWISACVIRTVCTTAFYKGFGKLSNKLEAVFLTFLKHPLALKCLPPFNPSATNDMNTNNIMVYCSCKAFLFKFIHRISSLCPVLDHFYRQQRWQNLEVSINRTGHLHNAIT